MGWLQLQIYQKQNWIPCENQITSIDDFLLSNWLERLYFDRLERKSQIIKETIEGDISSEVPATYLQNHQNTTFVLDNEAGGALTRNKTSWLVKPSVWNEELKSKAIVWLCEKTNKSILKLTDKDYNDNSMSSLLAEQGKSYNLNIEMFNKLQHTITGWPGGKPNSDDLKRPERSTPAKKRVLIFSPHPDDDVVAMGGTFIRLVDQGHEVHVAYQTNGSMAVHDEDVLNRLSFMEQFNDIFNLGSSNVEALSDRAKSFFQTKGSSSIDLEEIRDIKSLIRKRVKKVVLPESLIILDKEQVLIKKLLEFPSIIQDASDQYSPAILANFIYDLVKNYNNYYQSTPILTASSEDKINFRLALSIKVGEIIKTGMALLGCSVPKQM